MIKEVQNFGKIVCANFVPYKYGHCWISYASHEQNTTEPEREVVWSHEEARNRNKNRYPVHFQNLRTIRTSYHYLADC